MLSHRVLVTGSEGQLGHELCRLLGPHAVGLDLPELDITDRDAVLVTLKTFLPEIVINAAAFTQVDRAELEPETCRAVNLHGVENLVAACTACDSMMVQVSTDYVFDGRQQDPYAETDRPNPLNMYGQAKWEAEQMVARHPRNLTVRTAGLFGPGGTQAVGNFVRTMLRLAREGRPLRIVDDQLTSFTYAADLAQGILSLLEAEATGLYHVTNSGSASWRDFAAEIFRLANLQPEVQSVPMAEYPCAARRPRFSALSTAKYASVRGHYPMPHWREALSRYLQDLRDGSSC